MAENTAAGQNVGAALTATDDDGHTLTYTLEGADAASFDILSTSGQIQTKAGVTYNHEATSTYTVVVKADDSNGGTDTVTVTITVTDVNEPPGRPAALGDRDRGIEHQPGRGLDRADEHRPRHRLLRPAIPRGHHQRPAERHRHQRRHREPGGGHVV